MLADPEGREVQALSFWDHESNAAAYNSTGYPSAVKILEALLDGVPFVKREPAFLWSVRTIQNFSDFQAIQLWRIEWLLGAVALFLAGILLRGAGSIKR